MSRKKINKMVTIKTYADFDAVLMAMIAANDDIARYEDYLYNYSCSAPDCSECYATVCRVERLNDEISTAKRKRDCFESMINHALSQDNIITVGECIDYAKMMETPQYVVIDCYDEYQAEYFNCSNRESDIIPQTVYNSYCKYITYTCDGEMVICNDAEC